MEWMLLPLRRYADFSGRSRRKEYWMFILLQILIIIPVIVMLGVLGALDGGGDEFSGPSLIFLIVIGLFFLAMFIPSLAVQVRRFHDQDKSGWFVLLGFIPYVGSLIVFVFMCLDGTKGENQYGPDPKMDKNVGDVFS